MDLVRDAPVCLRWNPARLLMSVTVVLESYITHIRIIEDAAYPSGPPPPNANPDAKKPRLIIVAVRKSGRVRMHKARENVNGTFSIGKTWMLDDLTAVQSFSGSSPSNPEEEELKLWAGGNGFIVTIGKPYYWQANTPKEKQFFIASLVKIYTKYTGGKSPELVGFDNREREQLLGGAARLPPPQQPSAPGPPYGQPQNRPPRRDPSREPPALRQQPSREAMQRPPPGQMPTSGNSSFTSQTSRPPMRTRREESPSSIDSNAPLVQQGQGQGQRDLRRLAGSNQSQESFGRSDDGASGPPRSRGGLNGLPNAPGRFQDRSMTPTSLRAGTPDSGFSSIKDIPNDVPPVPAPLRVGEPQAPPPERRRPPMPIIGDSRQRGQGLSENIVPAPLASPGMRREELRPPVRSSERTQPRDRDPEINGSNGSNNLTSSNDSNREDSSQQVSELSVKREAAMSPAVPATEPVQPSPMTSPIESPSEPEEEVRPGLGPMIKKKSKGDIANTFLRAAKTANAFNSFKPRAGGAAERLRETQARSPEGPDGITSVVPAPSLIRGISGDNSNATTPTPAIPEKLAEKAPLKKANDSIPEVKITVPGSDRPSSVEGPFKVSQENVAPEKPKAREVKRPKPASETMQKELASLGIDPIILGGRGNDLVSAWDEFGWVGEGVHTKNIDQMRDEIERELNKIQAGGWLSRLEEEDERVEAIQKGLDKCIDECDELDGLLTLYLVELGVSLRPPSKQALLLIKLDFE